LDESPENREKLLRGTGRTPRPILPQAVPEQQGEAKIWWDGIGAGRGAEMGQELAWKFLKMPAQIVYQKQK
jgi:hypothetical protein